MSIGTVVYISMDGWIRNEKLVESALISENRNAWTKNERKNYDYISKTRTLEYFHWNAFCFGFSLHSTSSMVRMSWIKVAKLNASYVSGCVCVCVCSSAFHVNEIAWYENYLTHIQSIQCQRTSTGKWVSAILDSQLFLFRAHFFYSVSIFYMDMRFDGIHIGSIYISVIKVGLSLSFFFFIHSGRCVL